MRRRRPWFSQATTPSPGRRPWTCALAACSCRQALRRHSRPKRWSLSPQQTLDRRGRDRLGGNCRSAGISGCRARAAIVASAGCRARVGRCRGRGGAERGVRDLALVKAQREWRGGVLPGHRLHRASSRAELCRSGRGTGGRARGISRETGPRGLDTGRCSGGGAGRCARRGGRAPGVP